MNKKSKSSKKSEQDMFGGPITSELVKWLEDSDWDERPEIQGSEGSVTDFRYSANGKYGLNCRFQAIENEGIFALYASPDFSIPTARINEAAKYSAHHRSSGGAFNIDDEGDLIYQDSRGVTTETFNGELISDMLNSLDDYVSSVAEGLMLIVNEKRTAAQVIKGEQ